MQFITNLKTQLSDFISQHKKATIIGGIGFILLIALILILVFTLTPKEKPLVVKNELPPIDPRILEGYTFYQGVDYSIPVGETPPVKTENVSLTDLHISCEANRDCGGFSTFTNNFLDYDQPKSQWVKIPNAKPTEGLYLRGSFKYRLLPIAIPGYVFLPNQSTNYGNNSFVNSQTVLGKPLDVVAAACTNENRCTSFNTDGALQSEIYRKPTDYVTFTDEPTQGIYVKKMYDSDVPAEIKRATSFRK